MAWKHPCIPWEHWRKILAINTFWFRHIFHMTWGFFLYQGVQFEIWVRLEVFHFRWRYWWIAFISPFLKQIHKVWYNWQILPHSPLFKSPIHIPSMITQTLELPTSGGQTGPIFTILQQAGKDLYLQAGLTSLTDYIVCLLYTSPSPRD